MSGQPLPTINPNKKLNRGTSSALKAHQRHQRRNLGYTLEQTQNGSRRGATPRSTSSVAANPMQETSHPGAFRLPSPCRLALRNTITFLDACATTTATSPCSRLTMTGINSFEKPCNSQTLLGTFRRQKRPMLSSDPQSPLASYQQGTRPHGFGVSPIDPTSQGFASAMTEDDDAGFLHELLRVKSPNSSVRVLRHPMGRT